MSCTSVGPDVDDPCGPDADPSGPDADPPAPSSLLPALHQPEGGV